MSFGLAKEFIPRSISELHAQIQSYLASCHFNLRQYPQALEAGKESYKIRPGRSQVCTVIHVCHILASKSIIVVAGRNSWGEFNKTCTLKCCSL